MEQAFNAAKMALAAAAKLEHPQVDFPISLMVDVSGSHMRCPATLLSFLSDTLESGVEGEEVGSSSSCTSPSTEMRRCRATLTSN